VDYENTTGSDHELIKFDIITDESDMMLDATIGKYNFQKTDWEKFRQVLQSDSFDRDWVEFENNEEKLETMSISLRNAIQHAIEQSTPILRVCVRSKTWWNDEISTKRKLMSSKMRSWRRNRTNNNFESYKTARNEYFREIRVSKQTT